MVMEKYHGVKMKISLVLTTINRLGELERFLKALDRQTYRNFELILVDQNPDGYLAPLLDSFQGRFQLYRYFSEPGSSLGRTVGLKHLSGDIVAFPDDDCWYPPDLLEKVRALFERNHVWDGISGQTIDENGSLSVASWSSFYGYLTVWNIWTRGVIVSYFFKRKTVEQVGAFDETLGLGIDTPWGAGEDVDFFIRAVKSGARIFYTPEIKVYHPQTASDYSERELRKSFSYGMGMGRVLRKHSYPKWFVGYRIFRGCVATLIALLRGNCLSAQFHWNAVKGRWFGWKANESKTI